MSINLPLPPFAIEHEWRTFPARFLALVEPERPPLPMPRPFGESATSIEASLIDWRVHPDVTDTAWPVSLDANGQGSFQVAKRLRFLLWRLEVQGWTP